LTYLEESVHHLILGWIGNDLTIGLVQDA